MSICKIISTAVFTGFLFTQGFAVQYYEGLIPNYNSQTVSVVRLPDGVIIKTIPVGLEPYGLATTPDMKTTYVVNYGSNSVSVINLETNSVVATIPVENNPYLIAITPDGTQAYVTNYHSDTVSVINTSTNTVTQTINVGSNPYAVVVSPNGERAYVINYGGGDVSVIDTSSNTLIQTVTVGLHPYFPAVSLDNAYLYVPNYGDGTVSIINTTTYAVTALTINGYAQTVFITPDGAKAYVPLYYQDNLIYIIDTATNTPDGTITVEQGPYSVAFTADGATAYVGNYDGESVSIVDVATGTVVRTLSIGVKPDMLALTPDETQIASVNEPGFLLLMNTLTQNVTQTTPLDDPAPYFIAFGLIPIQPPSNLTGEQKRNRYLTQTDIYNVLTWNPPSRGLAPVLYNIYRDNLNTLIGIVPANGTLSFKDNNRKKNTVYTYYVVSQDAEGTVSVPTSIKILP